MNLFNLMATLGLDSTEFENGVNKAQGSAGKLSGTIKKLAIPAALGAIGKKSIEVGMDFEAAMSQVGATMGMTAQDIQGGSKDFELLANAAKEAGSTTQFSATEAADALNYLALAGYDASTAAETLPTVLNLAAAGGMDLAYASDLVTDSMSALGLKTDKATEFTDQLAKTSQKSNTNISQLGEAILTVGGTAKIMAGGTVELNTQLGILADNGVKGAEGGTALRNILLSLSAPTDKAAKLMKQLGLETYDANGNLRPTNEIFQDLNKILGTMTQEGRTNVLNQLFNKVDLKSVNSLLAYSGDRFNNLSKEIENSDGAAKKYAETMNANLAGALKGLSSAMESIGIAIYEKFGPTLTTAVNAVANAVRGVTQAFTEGKLDGILAAIGAALGGIVTYLTIIKGIAIVTSIIAMIKPLIAAASMVKSLSGAMAILNAVMAANPIGLLVTAIGALVGAFIYLYTTQEWFRNMWANAWEFIKGVFSGAWELIKAGFTNLMNLPAYLAQKIEELKQAWSQKWESIKAKTREVVTSIGTFFAELPGKLWTTFTNCIAKAVQWVSEMRAKGIAAAKELFTNFMDGVKGLPGEILALGAKIPQMLWDGIKNAGSWLKNTVKGWVKGLFSFGNIFLSLPPAPQGLAFNGPGATSGYALAGGPQGRAMGSPNFGTFRGTTNVSLNIGGREFDNLVIKTVSNNYDKIESIVQQRARGRR